VSSRDWDASTYDRVSDPQLEWAREQLGRLPLGGDEVVLDAGCGSGRVTELLIERVPRGRVYAVDVAPSMVEHARQALGDRATVLCQDLVEEFRKAADSVAGEEPFEHFFVGWQRPWNYAKPDETAARLEHAGFTNVECWLEPRRVQPDDPRSFVRTVCLVRHLDPLPDGLRGPFIDRVLARAGDPVVLDYVRLNMTARKP
jgi:trans-aconitate 2-methyltransferase